MDAVRPDSFLVEVLDHHGRAQTRLRFPLVEGRGEATVGRGLAADVLIDDAHAAAVHVRIAVDDTGAVRLSDLGSLNGLVVGGKREHGATEALLTGEVFQIGRTRLRVRTASEKLPAEKPEGSARLELASASGRLALAGAGAFLLYGAYAAWVEAPRDVASSMVTHVAFSAGAAAIWITAWALLARMLTGEWRWLRQAALFFGVMVAIGVIENLLEIAAFAWSLPPWPSRELLLGVLGFGALLFGHLSIASHLAARHAVILAAVLPLLVGGTSLWVQSRSDARNVNHIGMDERIYPGALRLRAGKPLDTFFANAATLSQQAEARRKEVPADDDADEIDLLD
ncbi:MAG: FHA domain-containing protein [Betaproteobacteria bacterium]|nr:FHA domain-containing protein [Betaproteobacteria bacterium]